MRFFLVCPANFATGGTELLHQFSKHLSEMGIENYMIYPDGDGIHCPTPDSFLKYGVKYVTRFVDAKDSVLVLTETQIHLINECRSGLAMIWWLSVDNYFNSYRNKMTEENIDPFGVKGKKNVVHFVQSYYAKDFVENGMGVSKTLFLKDYINDDIVRAAEMYGGTNSRENICVYNPKKGLEDLKPVMEFCREDIKWIALQGMTPEEMAKTMCSAKVYVDFGNHPGKDRIPREAAMCGCLILTNRKGSAAYKEDVAIPNEYRLPETSEVKAVLERLYELVDGYEEKTGLYGAYREKIRGEKAEFLADMKAAVTVLREQIAEKGQTLLPEGRYDSVNESLKSAAKEMEYLTLELQQACGRQDKSQAINLLYNLDFVMQIMRESVYAELVDMKES